MKVIERPEEAKAFSLSARERGRTVVLVPTMGFLHEGHRELLRTARSLGDTLVLSIFVNPTQFGPSEDLTSYPRDMERDLGMAREQGVDAVFTPSPEDMYPEGFSTYVEVEGLSKRLCGRSRPGHFRGVATVVLKLFNMVMPHEAVFGLKDYQQFVIIKRMVEDLNLEVRITGVETVRDADGVAVSSRNSYLSAPERKAAQCIPASLDAAEGLFRSGEAGSGALIEKMKKIIEQEPLAVVEYISICDPRTLEDVERVEGRALVALAVRIGRARLIDNRVVKALKKRF